MRSLSSDALSAVNICHETELPVELETSRVSNRILSPCQPYHCRRMLPLTTFPYPRLASSGPVLASRGSRVQGSKSCPVFGLPRGLIFLPCQLTSGSPPHRRVPACDQCSRPLVLCSRTLDPFLS